jgi:hypothetical protein
MTEEVKSVLPDELFVYRLFCQGAQLLFLSPARSVEEMWKLLRTTDMVKGWERHKDGTYGDICVRTSAVIAIDAPTGTTPIQPNREERRKDALPPVPKMPSAGQVAKRRG